MLYAIIKKKTIVQIGTLNELFPNNSFPINCDLTQFMLDNNVLPVAEFTDIDVSAKLVAVDPYIKDNKVYRYEVISKTSDELYADETQLKLNKLSELNLRVNQELDLLAKLKNYYDIITLVSYANSTIKSFRDDAAYGIQLRDNVRIALSENTSKYLKSEISFDELLATLPNINW